MRESGDGVESSALDKVLKTVIGALLQPGEALFLHVLRDLVQLFHVLAGVDVRHVDLPQPFLEIAVLLGRLPDVLVLAP